MSEEEELVKKIEAEFDKGISEIKIHDEHRIEIIVEIDTLVDLSTFIKHDLGFTIPNMCTGIDQKEHMDVVWHVGSPDSPILIKMRVSIDRDNSVVPSLKPIWQGMNWHERETYDLLGVQFEGHDDLRRILMPENWEGHPLREDYVYKKPTYRKPEDFE